MCYKDPCVDPAYTEIVAPDSLDNYSYTITNNALTDTVQAFNLVTKPDANHGLCGELVYEFDVDGQSVPTTPDSNDPIAFDPAGPREIQIESSDPDHVGTSVYTVTASLVNYPNGIGIPDAESSGEIEIISPCSLEGEIQA